MLLTINDNVTLDNLKDINQKLDELNHKIDNLHSLFEKIRNNEVRTLLYAQLCSRQLNSLFYIDQIRNGDSTRFQNIYEQILHDTRFRRAHVMTKNNARDLTNLVVKKSKGRKDLLEDEFTNSLAFISGIDGTLL